MRFYRGKEFKQIHEGKKVNKYINNEGMIISVDKNGEVIEESYGNKTHNGYMITTNANLIKKGTNYVHRLVALCFIGNPPDDSRNQVDHIDGCRTNNNASNLRWVTPAENANNVITLKRKEQSKKVGKAHWAYGRKFKRGPQSIETRMKIGEMNSKEAYIIIDGKLIVKENSKELVSYLRERLDIKSNVYLWFTFDSEGKRKIPMKWLDRVSFVGYKEEYDSFLANDYDIQGIKTVNREAA